jgi:hypothetical protein
VDHEDWKMYDIELSPEIEVNTIILECFYKSTKNGAYNGNILIDNLSNIIQIS